MNRRTALFVMIKTIISGILIFITTAKIKANSRCANFDVTCDGRTGPTALCRSQEFALSKVEDAKELVSILSDAVFNKMQYLIKKLKIIMLSSNPTSLLFIIVNTSCQ